MDDDRYDGNYLTVDPEPGTILPEGDVVPGGDGSTDDEDSSGDSGIINPPPTYPPQEGTYGDNFIYHLQECPPSLLLTGLSLKRNEAYFYR